jgi:hypothetical protein
MDGGILFSAVHLAEDELCVAECLRGDARGAANAAKAALRGLPARTPGERRSVHAQQVVFHVRTATAAHLAVAICATRADFPAATAFDCLGQLLAAYEAHSSDASALEAALRRITDEVSDPSYDKLAKIQCQIDAVKGSIPAALLSPGVNIEDLVANADQLAADSRAFEEAAARIKRRRRRNVLMCLFGGGSVVAVGAYLIYKNRAARQ